MQITAIRGARRYFGDRLFRTTKPHKLLDPEARPLIAVRLNVLARKTLGGLQTSRASLGEALATPPISGDYSDVGSAVASASERQRKQFRTTRKADVAYVVSREIAGCEQRRILLINDGNLDMARPMKTTAARLKSICAFGRPVTASLNGSKAPADRPGVELVCRARQAWILTLSR